MILRQILIALFFFLVYSQESKKRTNSNDSDLIENLDDFSPIKGLSEMTNLSIRHAGIGKSQIQNSKNSSTGSSANVPLRIAIMGEPGVGKSAFVTKCTTNRFLEYYSSQIGMVVKHAIVMNDEKRLLQKDSKEEVDMDSIERISSGPGSPISPLALNSSTMPGGLNLSNLTKQNIINSQKSPMTRRRGNTFQNGEMIVNCESKENLLLPKFPNRRQQFKSKGPKLSIQQLGGIFSGLGSNSKNKEKHDGVQLYKDNDYDGSHINITGPQYSPNSRSGSFKQNLGMNSNRQRTDSERSTKDQKDKNCYFELLDFPNSFLQQEGSDEFYTEIINWADAYIWVVPIDKILSSGSSSQISRFDDINRFLVLFKSQKSSKKGNELRTHPF